MHVYLQREARRSGTANQTGRGKIWGALHVTARSKNMRSLIVEAQLEYFTLVGPGYDLFELC
jgi:hypothetical protein